MKIIDPSYTILRPCALDAVALDVGVAQKKMADLPGKFVMLPEIVMTETYGIGFKKGNVALRDEVEAELKKLFANGTAAKRAIPGRRPTSTTPRSSS